MWASENCILGVQERILCATLGTFKLDFQHYDWSSGYLVSLVVATACFDLSWHYCCRCPVSTQRGRLHSSCNRVAYQDRTVQNDAEVPIAGFHDWASREGIFGTLGACSAQWGPQSLDGTDSPVRDELNHGALRFAKEQRIRCLFQGSWFPTMATAELGKEAADKETAGKQEVKRKASSSWTTGSVSEEGVVMASRGRNRQGKLKGGERGEDIMIEVPVGTVIRELSNQFNTLSEAEQLKAAKTASSLKRRIGTTIHPKFQNPWRNLYQSRVESTIALQPHRPPATHQTAAPKLSTNSPSPLFLSVA